MMQLRLECDIYGYIYIYVHILKNILKKWPDNFGLESQVNGDFYVSFLVVYLYIQVVCLINTTYRLDVTNRRKVRGKDDWLLNPTDTELYQGH